MIKPLEQKQFKLPECGIYIGSGIYPMSTDYLLSTLYAHQSWAVQSFSPQEMIDKIIEDNQGNLAQFWGYSRGYSPKMLAEWIYALDEIGVTLPEPDWENKKYWRKKDCPEFEIYADRRGAGALRFAREAKNKGIYTTFIYTDAHPKWSSQLEQLGEYYLGYDFGESFTFRFEEKSLKGKDLSKVSLPDFADDFVTEVKEHVDKYRRNGWGPIMGTSCNFYIDYEIAAGADIPLLEDFAFQHLNMASALSRGLYRQYNLPVWGSHLAHEHYAWIPYQNKYRFDLLKVAMYQKYMGGAKIIINESGNWFVEASLVEDSPKHELPIVDLGPSDISWHGGESPVFSSYIEEARKHFHKVDYSSDVCKNYRKVISDFYNFVKANGTPEGQPEVSIAVIKGNYDLCSAEFTPNSAIAGAYSLAEQNPLWFEGAPEKTWDIVKNVFFPLKPVLGKNPNAFVSGTPYGMVDIVSFAQDHVNSGFLSDNYKTLLFAGWNTASKKQYNELNKFVKNGGTLFISIPHLSTNVTRNYSGYNVEELLFGGDFSELCGLKVKKRGRRFHWATAVRGNSELGFGFPRRFGHMQTCMGEIEITDPEMETLVVDDEQGYPFLLRRKHGKGIVYFLNSWAYPGAVNYDQGPGAIVDSPGLIGMIYSHIAKQNRGTYWISDDGFEVGEECKYIAFSYFPESEHICLQNIDFEQPHKCFLHCGNKTWKFNLMPQEFRLIETRKLLSNKKEKFNYSSKEHNNKQQKGAGNEKSKRHESQFNVHAH